MTRHLVDVARPPQERIGITSREADERFADGKVIVERRRLSENEAEAIPDADELDT